MFKEIGFALWNFLTIGLSNALLAFVLGLANLTPGLVLVQLYLAFLVGSIPLTIYVLVRHNRMLRQNLKEAIALNRLLGQAPPARSSSGDKITVTSDSGQSARLEVSSFLYAVSDRNYVRMFVHQDDDLVETVIRATLKGIEDSFQDYPFILRCHRAYIVNTRRVTSVNGNAQGYRLGIHGSGQVVPVSRRYIPLFKSLIEVSAS